jgi:hypothetical protein
MEPEQPPAPKRKPRVRRADNSNDKARVRALIKAAKAEEAAEARRVRYAKREQLREQ